jgi:hypothetical protein
MIALALEYLPGAFWAGLGALGAFLAAIIAARQMGVKSAKLDAERRNTKSLQTAKDTSDEIDGIANDDVRKRLREWQRK